jgi:hypothetical protein
LKKWAKRKIGKSKGQGKILYTKGRKKKAQTEKEKQMS